LVFRDGSWLAGILSRGTGQRPASLVAVFVPQHPRLRFPFTKLPPDPVSLAFAMLAE
jgi:hypothetical protein